MVDPTPPPASLQNVEISDEEASPTPFRCFSGAVISGALAVAAYALTSNIHQTFASKPVPAGNVTAINIATAVRTLVLGMSALATVTFGIATLGLLGLGIQLLIKSMMQPQSDDSPKAG